LRDAGAMKAEAVARHMAARKILEADIVWSGGRGGPRYLEPRKETLVNKGANFEHEPQTTLRPW
jgi:hypothetical protein